MKADDQFSFVEVTRTLRFIEPSDVRNMRKLFAEVRETIRGFPKVGSVVSEEYKSA